jgi:hypothetical protein
MGSLKKIENKIGLMRKNFRTQKRYKALEDVEKYKDNTDRQKM